MKKPVITVQIPNGADRNGVSIDHPQKARDAFHSRVWINGEDVSGSCFSFHVVHRKGIKRIILELKDFEIYEEDELLAASELV